LGLVLSAAPPLRPSAFAQAISDKTKGLTRLDGFVTMYWDGATGKLFLEVTPGQEMIYVVSLPAGLGSNDIGLDRGQLSGERIVRFDRVGPRVLLTQPNPAADQRRALESVLATLRPEALALPRPLLSIIPPRPSGFDASRELFDRETGLSFDAVRPAATAADMVISLLLDEERAARLVQQHALDAAQPGLDLVLGRLTSTTFGPVPADGYHAELGRAIQRVVVERLMDLAATAGMPQVRAVAALQLEDLRRHLGAAAPGIAVPERAHRQLLASDIRRFAERGWERDSRVRRPVAPPGSPIGDH
jgi:hypothetical protein